MRNQRGKSPPSVVTPVIADGGRLNRGGEAKGLWVRETLSFLILFSFQ